MRIHLITGGSASGKSLLAEQRVLDLGDDFRRYYIATMKPWDAEMLKKIERHQVMRAQKAFTTIECSVNTCSICLADEPDDTGRVILLECMSNLVANEIYDCGGSVSEVCSRIMDGIRHLQKLADHLIIVTNEVFSDGCDYSPETVTYIRTLGRVNKELGSLAERVTEVVYGIPIELK